MSAWELKVLEGAMLLDLDGIYVRHADNQLHQPHQRHSGRKYWYAYSIIAKLGRFLFEGFVKHDLPAGEAVELLLPAGVYASEAPFAPRGRRGRGGRRLPS